MEFSKNTIAVFRKKGKHFLPCSETLLEGYTRNVKTKFLEEESDDTNG